MDNGAALEQSLQNDFEDFFENSLNGHLILTVKRHVLRANKRVAEWLGTSPQELVGKSFTEFLSIGGRIFYETHLAPLIAMQGFFDEVAIEFSGKGGSRFQVLMSCLKRDDVDGRPPFLRITVYQATERQIYEQNLRLAKELAETKLAEEKEDALLREQFIAVLGHDLRNPLGAITTASELLQGMTLQDEATQVAGMISRSCNRMNELISNVMDFAKGRLGGGMKVERKPTDLRPLIDEVIEEFTVAWPTRTIERETRLDDPVYCDVGRIGQLLSNLLANALTHGRADTPVIVKASLDGDDFKLSVSNQGKPIPAEAMGKLFEPFRRYEVHKSQNGLGLGLYIASEITRAHSGTLSVISNEDETRFTLLFPRRCPAE